MELLCHCETPALRTEQWGTVSGITIRLSPTEGKSRSVRASSSFDDSESSVQLDKKSATAACRLRFDSQKGQNMFLRHYVRIASYLTGNMGNWPERHAYHLLQYSAKAQKSAQLHIHAI